ncbi:MAG: hypothetical protein AMJ92_06255 [candidate division Zixibacteria bacterium SM23_81]|nr:MAG: hypothetical protein AMJ92_06255 [candidate division Zixibacteria bacterium SM23_81]
MKTALKERPAVKPKREKLVAKKTLVLEEKRLGKESPVVKEKAIQEIPENMGLCTTCNEAPNCAHAKNSKKPILFCEMFDDSHPRMETAVPEQSATAGETKKPQVASAPEKSETSKLKGLCVNCDNRETCTFPKPEGGVWHCEEYA